MCPVIDHLLGLVGDDVVDLLERRGGEQVVLLQEFAVVLDKLVELPGIHLSALVIVKGDSGE